MIQTVGTADEVGVLIFEFAALAFADTGVEVAQELGFQRLAERATGTAKLLADDFLVGLG
ncbi:hypothetical protein D3C87_2017150 [compost metagenome]